MGEPITLVIARSGPGGEQPREERVAVTAHHDDTVLALMLRAREQHPDLAFRCACRHGMCGDCALNLNGQPALACRTLAREAAEGGELHLGPLPGYAVERDLVVDLSPFWASFRAATPWLEPADASDAPLPGDLDDAFDADACILCGACAGACPSSRNEAFPGPHGLYRAQLRVLDRRDEARGRLKQLGELDGVARCRTVGVCTEVCPKGLDPADAIAALRERVMRGRR
jgi:succinate dehydrogenase / fumarate reductase iron-sulfur subunit